MTELFMKLLNMSINAGWLVLAVLLVRIIFRKAPKWLFPLLWSFVGIRLLMPNALESRLSIIPNISSFSASAHGMLSAESFAAPVPYVGIVWCTGMAAMLLFEALSYIHLRSKVKTAVRLSANVYQSEHVNAPFILGLFAPRIYIPFHIKSKELDSIIAHERAHIKRRDHWLKPIAFLILSLHWFNPLIWIAYYFLCKDIELACDECAVKNMSDSQRAAYSQTLLSCTANQSIFAACPLAFGSKNVKTRIRAVLSYRKPHTWIITVTAILVLVVAACFMTNPRQSKESTARESNYIGLNQSPISDMIQNGQTISDRNSSEERQREVELESALLGEAIKKQESLTRIEIIPKLLKTLYEDKLSGKTSEDNDCVLSQEYSDEREQLQKKILKLRRKLTEMGEKENEREEFIHAIRKFMEMRTLTKQVLNELIDHIDVYETQGTGKNKTQRLVIYYKFVGYLDIDPTQCRPNYTADIREGIMYNKLRKLKTA